MPLPITSVDLSISHFHCPLDGGVIEARVTNRPCCAVKRGARRATVLCTSRSVDLILGTCLFALASLGLFLRHGYSSNEVDETSSIALWWYR